MTTSILWSWHAEKQKWFEIMPCSQRRCEELAAERQAQAEAIGIKDCRFVALPVGQTPDDSMIPGILPLAVEEPAEPEIDDDALEAAEYRAQVEGLVDAADLAIREAAAKIASAHNAVDMLAGDRVYDIEFAESPDGVDALAELAVAARALRNVARIVEARRARFAPVRLEAVA